MSSKSMRLKDKIRNYAKDNRIASQVVMQNYMFERFLSRLSASSYSQKFVLKGGVLVAALVGLDTRSTMDLDATLRNLPLTEGKINEALLEICSVEIDDDVIIRMLTIEPIRKDDRYGGFRVHLEAKFDTIVTPLSIDISTGDVITPQAVRYEFRGIFDDNLRISVWGYNIETVLAEKIETILRRGVFNTRPKDFYDIYILTRTLSYEPAVLREALQATAEHRGSVAVLSSVETILQNVSESLDLRALWKKYQSRYAYAANITYSDIISAIGELLVQLIR